MTSHSVVAAVRFTAPIAGASQCCRRAHHRDRNDHPHRRTLDVQLELRIAREPSGTRAH